MAYKVLFAGTPEVAAIALKGLLDTGVEVVGVLTREDAPVGRKRRLSPSPVALLARELGLPIIKANRWNSSTATEVAAIGADIAAVVAFGSLLPQSALDMLPQGWINLHFSSLPAWRGAAPVQRALMAGETEIFSNTFRLEAGMDTGPVFMEESVTVAEEDTAGTVLSKLATSGGALLAATFNAIAAGHTGTTQSGEPSYAPKLSLAEGQMTWNSSCQSLLAQFRGVTPEPGAWCEFRGDRFKVGMLRSSNAEPEGEPGTVHIAGKKPVVTCADGCLELVQVQPAGKKMMNAADWMRGVENSPNQEKVVLV